MARRRWLRRVAALLLLLVLGAGASGCGVKGRPKPADPPVIPGL